MANDWRKKYDWVGPFSDGLAQVKSKKKYGFVNKQGEEVIPLKYNEVYPFYEGLAGVNVGGKYLKIGEDEDLGSSVGLVEGGQWGFVDETGKEVIPPKYDWVDHFYEGFAAVRLIADGKYGFIDKTGKEVIPLKYDKAQFFSDGLARVRLDGKWGYIDKQGRNIPEEYLTAVRLGGDIERILEIEKS